MYAGLRTKRHCREWSHFSDSQLEMCFDRLYLGSLAFLPGWRALPARRSPRLSLLLTLALAHVRRADDQLLPSLRLPCSWLHHLLGVPSPQRHWHLLAASTLVATSTHFLALLLLSACAPRPRNLATGKALPLLLSVLFLAHSFCVKHGMKGLRFHRRCRGKWSCQKGFHRRHRY